MDKTMMGKENPCCILSIQHLRSDLEDIGYHRVMIHDLAPYMRPVLEGVLENFFKQKQKKDDDGQAGKKVSFFVKLARAMLDGYESLFFVNGEKLIVKQRMINMLQHTEEHVRTIQEHKSMYTRTYSSTCDVMRA